MYCQIPVCGTWRLVKNHLLFGTMYALKAALLASHGSPVHADSINMKLGSAGTESQEQDKVELKCISVQVLQ